MTTMTRREFWRAAAGLMAGAVVAEAVAPAGWVRRLFPVGIDLRASPVTTTTSEWVAWDDAPGEYLLNIRASDFERFRADVRAVTGREPTGLILGASVWRELQRDPTLLDRVFGG